MFLIQMSGDFKMNRRAKFRRNFVSNCVIYSTENTTFVVIVTL